MSFQIGFDGFASAELTQLLNGLSMSLNARQMFAQVQTDVGDLASGVKSPGPPHTPCSNGIAPHEPNCVHAEFLYDPNTYTGAAIGFFVGVPLGIMVGALIGFGVSKMLINRAAKTSVD